MRFFIFIFSSFLFASHPSTFDLIKEASLRSALDPRLIRAMVKAESSFNPLATSEKGAQGLMQVMPETAKECGIHNAYHALNNLMGATECFRKLLNRYKGDLKLALAAYHAGPNAVDKYLKQTQDLPPFPATRTYVDNVLKEYELLKKKG